MPNPWWSIALWAWSSGMCNPASVKQRHYFTNKGQSSQSYGFSSSHVWMWELDYFKKAEHRRIDAFELWLEKTLESPLDCKEIQPIHPKGDQSWIFIGRTDAEAETSILWPLDAKNWLIWKDPDAGKDWRREEKGAIEDEMVGWHHQLNGHAFEDSGSWWWTGRPVCFSPWGSKELDTTEQLNWTILPRSFMFMFVLSRLWLFAIPRT